jgi:2-polyprenyl-3-methyl-5-hydroxy-6-metoxy-1,4-benzoquinol methylase
MVKQRALANEHLPPCLVCSTASELLRNTKGYDLYRCANSKCGHVFVWPLPDVQFLNEFYSKDTDSLENSGSWTMASDYRTSPELVHRFYKRTRLRRMQRWDLLGDPTQKILDVGCSTGMFLRVLKDRGFLNLAGQEISTPQVEYCLQHHGIQCVATLAEFENESFDLICLYAVLEHVREPHEILAEVSRLLRPDGKVIIDVPNYDSWYRRLSGDRWLWLIPPAHLQYFTPRSLSMLMEKAGLSVERNRTLSTSSYTFIAAYHFFGLLGRPLPTTSLAVSKPRNIVVAIVEACLRFAFLPFSLAARITRKHHQLIFSGKRCIPRGED